MNEVYRYPLKIREGHLDTFGHMNNAVYLQILEEARWEILNANGYGLDHIRKTGLGPTILEINLRFKRELRARQDVVIQSQLKSYEGKIAVFEQLILNEAGETCCEAIFKFGLFDTNTRRLVPPTPDWARAIGQK
jgi:acyl-CoA thioester hydrolase